MGNILPSSAHEEFADRPYELRPGGLKGHPEPVTVYLGNPGGIVEGFPNRAKRETAVIKHLGRIGTTIEDL